MSLSTQGAASPPTSARPRSVHAPDCSIWDTPTEYSAEALATQGIAKEGASIYFAAIQPLYGAINRVLGQFAGILILSQSGASDGAMRPVSLDVAAQQLREARERLGAVAAPAGAARHRDLLGAVAADLAKIESALRRRGELADPSSLDLDDFTRRLTDVRRRLLGLAEPRAGIAPVDFRHACCSCGVERPAGGALVQAGE